MRPYSALVLVALAFGATGLFLNSVPEKVQSQKAQRGGFEKSSLDIGMPFDPVAQQNFESGLSNEERASLIRLKSRYILADPSRPLPTLDPTQPFYLSLSSDMTAALKADLEAAGASVVGYAFLRTYMIRARDQAALERVSRVLANSALVLGTRLRQEMDACADDLWRTLQSGEEFSRPLRVKFWPDAEPWQAAALLSALECAIRSASTEPSGALNLETPYVDVHGSRGKALALVRHPLVQHVDFEPTLALHNQTSVNLAKANQVIAAPYNLTGAGEIAAIWDGGPVQLHTDYGGRVTNAETGTTSSHATHVFGTILGSGAGNSSARGFAPQATGFAYSFGGDVPSERRLRRHNSQHSADNHSYGNTSGYGGYDSYASIMDVDNRDLLMLMCKSAGNDGSGNTTITHDSGIKNGFCVGSLSDSGLVSGFSSRGPMNDGRLLPTICANGEQLTSTVPTNAYAAYSGTSMSGPSFCGSVILLSQLWKREHGNMPLAPDMARAIIAQTAVDVAYTSGSVTIPAGPDYATGFGLVDVKAAADLILADSAGGGSQLMRGIARQASVSNYFVQVSSSASPLKVTLSWLDTQPASGAAVILVNDLDLELIAPNGTTIHYPYSGLTGTGSQYTPFVQTGPNRRDNLEQAVVANPATGTWTIRVKGFSLPDPATPIGFVVACNRPMARDGVIYHDPLNSGTPVAIPDNTAPGVARTFNVTQSKLVRHVRAYVNVLHTQRGDISIRLRHPDNTEVLLEGNDTSTRDDIFGVFPDTRKYNDDVTSLYNKNAQGTWTITVRDNNANNTGSIVFCALEFEFDPPVAGNNPPAASAGVDFNVNEGASGQLNGTASFDPDGDPLTYAWTQVAGAPTIALSGAATATPTFTAPSVTVNTQFTFRVTVSDGRGGTSNDDVVVTVLDTTAPNNPPQANAGTDQNVPEGSTANLNGTLSSDPDGDALSFSWVQIAGSPTVSLSGSSTATPSFTAPSVSAATPLTFRLTVNDGRGGTDTDDVVITVLDTTVPNNPPVADAGPDQNVATGATVNLSGAASSDPDSDPLTYTWVQVAGVNTVVLTGTGATASFTAPAAADTLAFQLTVDDGRGGVDVDTVTVFVGAGGGPDAGGGGGGSKDDGGCTTGSSSSDLWCIVAGLMLLSLALRSARRSRPV